MRPVTLIDNKQFDLIINRLCYQLIENHNTFENTVILGLQPRGIFLADLIWKKLSVILKNDNIEKGHLDVTFFRDDFRRRNEPINPNSTQIDFIIEGKNVILIDDVLYTGRTIRAGMDAMLSYGRPQQVELVVLVDRKFRRELPIQADYIGKSVDTYDNQKVKVVLGDKTNKVTLFTTLQDE